MTIEADDNAPEGVSDAAAPDAGVSAPEVSPLERAASRMGWSPKEAWKGDPEKWVDAETFIERTPDVIKELRDRIERTNRTATKIIEKERQKAIKDAEQRLAKAKEDGDVEAVEEAAQELQEARTEARQSTQDTVKEFQDRNPWFGTNRAATALAKDAAQEVANRGGSKDEQFEAAEKAVREEFPQLFGSDLGKPSPKPAPKTPSMQGGQRTTTTAPQKRGWGDLPSNVRAEAERAFIRSNMLTREEYAEEYWKENN